MKGFSVCIEEGEMAEVVYDVVEDVENGLGMKYGIAAVMTVDGNKTDEYKLRQRFFTYNEAEMMAKAMCRHKVLPCTLADILRDLNEKY